MNFLKQILLTVAFWLSGAACAMAYDDPCEHRMFENQGHWSPLWFADDMAFLQSNDPDAEEAAAIRFFKAAYPKSKVITPSDFMKMENSRCPYTVIWIHFNRGGVKKGWRNVAEFYTVDPVENGNTSSDSDNTSSDSDNTSSDSDNSYCYSEAHGMNADEFISKLKDLAKNHHGQVGSKRFLTTQDHAVNLFFSGLASQFIEGIDRLDSKYPMNFYCGDDSNNLEKVSNYRVTELMSPWAVSGHVKNSGHDEGHNGFAAYGQVYDNWIADWGTIVRLHSGHYETQDGVYPILAPYENESIWTSDNNCIWKYDQENFINDFDRDNNAVVQGTWGSNNGYKCIVGLVEFLRNDQNVTGNGEIVGSKEFNFSSHIVVCGLGSYQWQTFSKKEEAVLPQNEIKALKDVDGQSDLYARNLHQLNLENFTYNILNYLDRMTEHEYISTGTADIETEENAVEPVYYTLSGVRIPQPANPGFYIRCTGKKVEKIAIR